MAFDPLRSRKEALEREQRLALLAEKRQGMEVLPPPGEAEYKRMRQDSEVGTSANGIGGGVENGPQWRAIAKRFREMAFGFNTQFTGKKGGGGLSPDNPYVAHAKNLAVAPGYAPGTLGEVALGRAANDALQYELAVKALEDKFGTEGRPRALGSY